MMYQHYGWNIFEPSVLKHQQSRMYIKKCEETMRIDLKALNSNQLGELIRRAEHRKLEIAEENLTKVQNKIHALLESEGLTLKDLFGQHGKARRRNATRHRRSAVSIQKRSGRGK